MIVGLVWRRWAYGQQAQADGTNEFAECNCRRHFGLLAVAQINLVDFGSNVIRVMLLDTLQALVLSMSSGGLRPKLGVSDID